MKTPQRPFLVKAFNVLRIPTKLEADSLIKTARRKSKLTDFGAEDFMKPLEMLLTSINEEANLHPFGRFITKERLVNLLINRLRIEELYQKHPEIEEVEIKSPIIIAGLQRTGTTRLHRLLSAHPDIRSLMSWEALNPAPIPGDTGNKKRIAFAKTAEKALRYMAPDFFAIHPVEHQAPEEDILLNDMSLISTVPEATLYVPTYAKWVEEQSHLPAYQYLKKVLKVLSWKQKPKRWVLKSPQYLEFLPEAKEVFPDAKFIHTYRDPLKIIPSFCSMVYHGRWVFSDEVNKQELAQHWMRKDAKMVNQALQYWGGEETQSVQHVSYYDMLADFGKEIASMLAFVDLPFDAQVEQTITAMNNQNKQHKYGVHRYALNDFGLEKDTVENQFAAYRKKFNIRYE